MGHARHWSESNEEVNLVFPVRIWLGKLVEHLSRSLRVTNISHFIVSSMFSYIVNLGWCIVVTHLGPAELPVCSIGVWVQSLVTHAVFSASLVSKPNIVALVYQLEGWSHVRPVHDPAVRRVDDTVL